MRIELQQRAWRHLASRGRRAAAQSAGQPGLGCQHLLCVRHSIFKVWIDVSSLSRQAALASLSLLTTNHSAIDEADGIRHWSPTGASFRKRPRDFGDELRILLLIILLHRPRISGSHFVPPRSRCDEIPHLTLHQSCLPLKTRMIIISHVLVLDLGLPVHERRQLGHLLRVLPTWSPGISKHGPADELELLSEGVSGIPSHGHRNTRIANSMRCHTCVCWQGGGGRGRLLGHRAPRNSHGISRDQARSGECVGVPKHSPLVNEM